MLEAAQAAGRPGRRQGGVSRAARASPARVRSTGSATAAALGVVAVCAGTGAAAKARWRRGRALFSSGATSFEVSVMRMRPVSALAAAGFAGSGFIAICTHAGL